MNPIDRFSGHAGLYAQFRIDYPAPLYDFILQGVPTREAAWDCATGNGQVAVALADWFTRVEATDISETQLLLAPQRPNITYQLSRAEQTPFAPQSFDLITIAQAVHWLDVDAFHAEVHRLARPGAVVAEWGYGLVQLGTDLDPMMVDFYRNWVGPYWDPQRAHIDDRYARLGFPFAAVEHATFTAERHWTLDRLLNYLRTWSAVRQYIHENDEDPVTGLGLRLQPLWGTGERLVQFPIFCRKGRV